MSRIRQIKPSWFLDKQLRRGTTADAREFYIGLWMLADDAGYLVWDVERIGAELYPYDPDRRRERNIDRWSETLETLDPKEPHLVVWDCGHARVPKMPGHQRIAGKQTFTVREAHRETCRDVHSRREPKVANTSDEPKSATDSPGIGRVGNGTVRIGTVGSARATEPSGSSRSEFAAKVPRPS